MGKTFTRERINHKAMLALTLVGACLCSGGCSLSPVAKYSPLAAFERSVIYQPADGTVGNWNPDGLNHEDVSFVSNDGTKLHGWFVPHSQPTAVALFLHGNAGNVTSRAQKLAGLNQQFGLSVMAFDYRGYGRSEGSPDEQGILNDARAARRWLAQRTGVSEADILIMGRSLGGAIAIDLAAKDGARGLAIASTFTSLPDVASSHFRWLPTKLLMTQRLDSINKIKDYTGPLLHCHGTADRVVPFAHGEALFAAAGSTQKQFVTLDGKGHNDPLPSSYGETFKQFVANLPPRESIPITASHSPRCDAFEQRCNALEQ